MDPSASPSSSAAAAAAAVARPAGHSLPRSPPLPLTTRSSSKNALRDADPPSTPPNRPRRFVGKGKDPVRRPGPQSDGQDDDDLDQYDDLLPRDRARLPIPPRGHHRPPHRERSAPVLRNDTRDSHGLSWSSTTRDSLVDNLLLSLDELSFPENPSYTHFDLDRHRHRESDPTTHLALSAMNDAAPSRARSHTYSSSLSSDRDPRSAHSPTASNLSSPARPTRRTASGSNFSLRNTAAARPPPPPPGFSPDSDSRRHDPPFSKSQAHAHARGYSDSSSTDLGFRGPFETTKFAFGGPRSVSMDHIKPLSRGGDSVLSRGRPVPSVYSSYDAPLDAAPEPMVPAGPRKMQNPTATGPVYVNQAPKQSGLRKTTTHTDLRAASTPTIPPAIREQASDFVRASSMRGDPQMSSSATDRIPPVPAAPATNPGAAARTDALSIHKERPGFFKRVFGSASRSHDRPDTSLERKSMSPVPPSIKTDSRQASGDQTAHQSQPALPPTLNKKPSSFFRRRKKSTGEPARPPPLPLAFASATAASNHPAAQQSPSVSSLRKVMDPFLSTSNRPANGLQTIKSADAASRPTTRSSLVSDDLDIFHNGYAPPPDASFDRRTPVSRGAPFRPGLDTNPSKMKVKKRAPDGTRSSADSRPSESSLLRDRAPPTTTGRDAPNPEAAKMSPSQEMREFAAGNNVDLYLHSDTWPMSHDSAVRDPISPSSVPRHLNPAEKAQSVADAASVPSSHLPTPPSMGVRNLSGGSHPSPATTETPFFSAVSLPLVQLDSSDPLRPSANNTPPLPRPSAYSGDATEHRERARRIFDGDETDVSKMEAASWLGESKSLNTRTLNEYMRIFDFSQVNILHALRILCTKLMLRGETQQFDRIITALSSRWCECNPTHGFKAQDVVHTICYSLILLNTDLHLAEIGEKMSRSAYVKNTLPTIRRVVADAAPYAFDETVRPTQKDHQSRPSLPWTEPKDSGPNSPALPPDTPQERISFDQARANGSKRSSVRHGAVRTESEGWVSEAAVVSNVSNTLVNSPWSGSMRGWEAEIELMLKSFFISIKNDPLPLLASAPAEHAAAERNLAVNDSFLKRSGSVVSRTPSEAISSRSKPGLRNLALGWQGRGARPRPKLYGTNTMSSSRTSFDDNNSFWSPAQSSTWSKNSAGKTLTSTSVNSLSQPFPPSDREYKHSIGFANALSHAIIREEGGGGGIISPDPDVFAIKGDLLEDDSLTLEGAPWAKEGLVKHKHHLDALERKAKERSWNECFAVISRGRLTLFSFTSETRSRSLGRPRTKQGGRSGHAAAAGNKVGGGDWMENAEQQAVFVLRHTLSSVLPPPGYSKTRPYVWSLSLPSGAVHLFQVGTPELAAEWMSTANYWSARLSKEPLSGGVSNVEYGWSEAVINPALLEKSDSSASFSSPPPSIMNRQQQGGGHGYSSPPGTSAVPRPSLHSSIRSSFDIGSGPKTRLPGDKVQITSWSAPSQSVMPSQLTEADQLKALKAYVAEVEDGLERHHDLKHAIELAVSPPTSSLSCCLCATAD